MSEVEELSAKLGKRFGALDVLVNNAAIDDKVVPGVPLVRCEDYDVEHFRRQLDVNVTGVSCAASVSAHRWRNAAPAAS